MHEPDRRAHAARAAAGACPRVVGLRAMVALALAGVAGCGATDADSCALTGGDGKLMVNITGHDSGAVFVEGIAGVVETSSVVTVPAGPHMITAARITAPQTGVTSRVFEGTVDHPIACVNPDATSVVNVSYALVPTSGRLWVGVGNAPDDSTMLGFDPGSLAATRTEAADVAANTGGSDGFTFDRAGNMWVLGGTTADPPLARYRAGLFASDGDKVPDVIIDSPSFGVSIPGAKVVAFDPDGNLWVSVVAAGKVVKLTAAQIAVNGNPKAVVERTGIGSPQGLAFDGAGNLWVAAHDDGAVIRIDAANLTSSGSGADLAITAQTTAKGTTLGTPTSLAFDATGNLWVNYDGTIASIRVADQAGTGEKAITPAVQITTDVLTLPVGIAFDQDGGLWLAHEAGKFARLGPMQLGMSGAITPDIIVSSPDVGYASWFAMYPAPPLTPLYHKVP